MSDFVYIDSWSPCTVHVSTLVALSCLVHTVYFSWRLRLSGDVEENPGPEHTDPEAQEEEKMMTASAITIDTDDIVKKIMQSVTQQLHEQTTLIRDDLRSIVSELGEVKDKCVEINERCDRLEREQKEVANAVSHLASDVAYLHTEMNSRKEESSQLGLEMKDLKDEMSHLHFEIDTLEQHSRRDNLRFFGIPHTSERDDFDTCVTAVVDVLNSVAGEKVWTQDDIVRAHRVGQARDGQPRPMIVRFSRWRDKMSILTVKERRDQLFQKKIRVANDLTRAQARTVAEAKRDGKRAYFKRGRMVIGPALPDPRTYAEVTATGNGQRGHQNNTLVLDDTGGTRHVLSPNTSRDPSRPSNAPDQGTIRTCSPHRGTASTSVDDSQHRSDVAAGGGGTPASIVQSSRGDQQTHDSVTEGAAMRDAGGSAAGQRGTADVIGDGKSPRVAGHLGERQSAGGRGGGNPSRHDVRGTTGARGGRRGSTGRQTELSAHWTRHGSGVDKNLRARNK